MQNKMWCCASEIGLFKGYGSIKAKTEGYGPIGKGGNGLILHSALAISDLAPFSIRVAKVAEI